MPIDFLEGRITREPVKLPSEMVAPTLGEAAVGSICFIDATEIAANHLGELIVNPNATVRSIIHGNEIKIRVIVTPDRYIVDQSHDYDILDEDDTPPRIESWEGFNPADGVKAIGYIRDPDSFGLAALIILSQYGIKVEPVQVQDL